MSHLTSPYVLIPTIGLTIQIIVLALLVYGYYLKRKFMIPQHGRIMAWATALHLTTIFAVMVPSFVLAVIPEYITRHVEGVVSLISLVHVPIGLAAVSLGLWFAVSWRFKGLRGCFNRKKLMLITMILWLFTLLLGITLYSIFYWAALMG
jgi:uncharacterized membrane protein YozB (DUF420 family)